MDIRLTSNAFWYAPGMASNYNRACVLDDEHTKQLYKAAYGDLEHWFKIEEAVRTGNYTIKDDMVIISIGEEDEV